MFLRRVSDLIFVVWLTVVGESVVIYRLLLELKVPRGEKQQMLARSTLIGRVFVVSALLTIANVLVLKSLGIW